MLTHRFSKPHQVDLRMNINELSYSVIGASIKLHTVLGPGLLESAYETALVYELQNLGIPLRNQVPIPFSYQGQLQGIGFRTDLIVGEKVLVEIKSVEALAPVHFAQTLTYLRLLDFRLGLLINFNTIKLKDGINRIVNNFQDSG